MDEEYIRRLDRNFERKIGNVPSASDGPYLDIVFDGPAGPEGGRFVEVENSDGRVETVSAALAAPGDHLCKVFSLRIYFVTAVTKR